MTETDGGSCHVRSYGKKAKVVWAFNDHAVGATFVKIIHGCACCTLKFQFLIDIFGSVFTNQYIYFLDKQPNFAQIGCFLHYTL